MSGVEIRPVASRRDLRAFIRLPHALYEGDPLWVPPLHADIAARLDRRRNPFFEHGDAAYFLALRGGRPVGRIAAVRNDLHNSHHGDRTGFFGFFETEHDAGTASALLDAAGRWAAASGLTTLRGPASFSVNDEFGLLVSGDATPPAILMPYNPPWYADLLLAAGFRPIMDLLAFTLTPETYGVERMRRIVERIRLREGVTLRKGRLADYRAEVDHIRDIYNDAWARNWGFVPITEAEIRHAASDLRPIFDSDFLAFVEEDGRPLAFSLCLPDINEILIRLRGRLFPTGILRILRGRRRTRRVRLLIMGVRQEAQRRGLDALLYYDVFETAVRRRKEGGELSWILETNTVMRNAILRMGGRESKRYRVFERDALPAAPEVTAR